jgi:D-alanyl-lipoteichoic acid acyltransferase DltB (MBOAT superfamily)
MLFNSIDFAVFLPIVFVLYWFVLHNNIKLQNLLIVISSYLFYGWWDYRFLALILFSTVVDFSVGRLLANEENLTKRRLLLWLSIIVNLGFLGFFKYYNFFLDNFVAAFSFLGMEIKANTLSIVLPVGISFYTFQTLSYTIDVYHRRIEPTKDFITFTAFVSFFPQLVAGPIERATHLLPQFYTPKIFHYPEAVDGMKQILWGLFKKMVIADNCAYFANLIFNDSGQYNGSTLLLGAVFFSFQIYGDFSGYSDIAIGVAKLFGFELSRNFAYPYFSRDIAEFWRKWHISLSTWFRDYLYIPLGGSRGNIWRRIRNVFVIFVVSGFWHGANWTFIVWGVLHAIYFLPLLLTKRNRKNMNVVASKHWYPTFREFMDIGLTYGLTLFAWIFFRAEDINHAINYITGLFSKSLFSIPDFDDRLHALTTIILVFVMIVFEWAGRNEQYAIARFYSKSTAALRWSFYLVLVFVIFWFQGEVQGFIYFQF